MEQKTDKENISNEAERFAIANTYNLDNSYLSSVGKTRVEFWFQFPSTIMFIVLCVSMIYSINNPLQLKYILGISIIADIVIGLVNYYVNLKGILRIFFLTIGHQFILWAIDLVTISLLVYHGFYLYSVIILFSKLGLIALVSLSMYIYSILSRKHNMHAKYAFFKRFYGIKFSFERDKN